MPEYHRHAVSTLPPPIEATAAEAWRLLTQMSRRQLRYIRRIAFSQQSRLVRRHFAPTPTPRHATVRRRRYRR